MITTLKIIKSILSIIKSISVPILDLYNKYCEKDPIVQSNWKNIFNKWAGKDNIPTKISDEYNDLRKTAEEDIKKNV